MRRFWAVTGLAAVGLLLAFVVWRFLPSRDLPAKEIVNASTERYQDIGKTSVKLTAVLGTHEEDPALGHTFAYAHNLKYALSASGYSAFGGAVEDGVLSYWNIEAGKVIRDWRIPKTGATALALSADGKRALLGLISLNDKNEQVIELATWDIDTGKKVHTFKVFKTMLTAVAIAADGKVGLSGSQDGEVRLWDLEKGKEISTLAKMNNAGLGVTALAFSPDGKFALGGGGEAVNNVQAIKVWEVSTGKTVHTLTGQQGPILSFAFSADGKQAASAGFDGAIKTWDLATGKERKSFTKDAKENNIFFDVASVALSPDGKRLLAVRSYVEPTGTHEHSMVTLWDTDNGKELWNVKAPFKGLTPIAFLDGKRAVGGGGASAFTHLDLASGKELKVWGGHKGAVNAVAVDGKGSVISAGLDHTLKVWHADGSEATLPGHAEGINALVLVDGKRVLTAGADKAIKLWDIAGGKELATFKGPGHSGNVTGLAVSADGKLAASASADRTIKLWDVASGKELQSLVGHADGVNAVAFIPGGKWLASAGDDNTVRLWPLIGTKQEGQPRTLDGHKRQVTTLAVTADGKQLISAGQDQTVKVWDVAEGKCVQTLEGHKNWINALAVHGTRLVSSSDDLTARLWDLGTGKAVEIIDLGKSSDCPRCVAFSPAGDSFVIGTTGWVVLRFELKK